jgi:hypothetical protein
LGSIQYDYGGGGKNTPFWESRWINGTSAKEIAPILFKLSRYKYRNVHTELRNSNWITNIQWIHSTAELDEYTMLYMAVSGTQLSDQKGFQIRRTTLFAIGQSMGFIQFNQLMNVRLEEQLLISLQKLYGKHGLSPSANFLLGYAWQDHHSRKHVEKKLAVQLQLLSMPLYTWDYRSSPDPM